MTGLDYAKVDKYWNEARPSILSPYMMEGFGFPAGAGQFRFRGESGIVERLIQGTNSDGIVLDLGSGIGSWTGFFRQRFAKVVAVEASKSLYEALETKCARWSNVETIHGDVMSFEPKDRYDLVFLGGLLMYLNEEDVVSLLRRIIPFLAPNAVVLCRETTVREGTVTREGEYQAVYRSVENYARIFESRGFSVVQTEMNAPYVLMQMGCESVKQWRAIAPSLLHLTPVAGRVIYYGLRLSDPWITRFCGALGISFPELTNHFFVLQRAECLSSSNHVTSIALQTSGVS